MLTSVFKLFNLENASWDLYASGSMYTEHGEFSSNNVPTILSKEQRSSKYKAQLFDCGVPGKIKVLQIPEKSSEDSNEGGTSPLRKTYVLSPRKLKKTSGVS